MIKGLLKHRIGELRPSQLVFTFGIGSIVELPYLSVMVMGLEEWPADQNSLGEPRLLAAVQSHLGPQVERLALPPLPEEDVYGDPLGESARVGVPVSPFPRWVYCPYCSLLGPADMGVFRLKADPFRPDRTQFVHENCPKTTRPPAVLPARFLASCKNGHIQDFPWRQFVHRGALECQGALRLYEWGVSGLASEVTLKCDACDASRNMAEAFSREQRGSLGPCAGERPHLRDHTETCSEELESVLAGASNVWFPLRLSLLSIPERRDPVAQLVEEHWYDLREVANAREAGLVIKFLPRLKHVPPEQVWRAMEKRSQAPEPVSEDPELKRPEWTIFSNPREAPRGDDFEVREGVVPAGFEVFFERVVLVPRLREVHAFVGFTRLESPGDFGGIEEVPEERWVPISRRKPTFVPATEVRGEGLFLQFREEALSDWLTLPAVVARGQELFAAHEAWRRVRRIEHPERNFPGMRYVLLHSFAHALMRQLALECGYTAASLRERLYSHDPSDQDQAMAGVLIYTATPDSEGTLGGLVELGRPEHLLGHLKQALDIMTLCTSDPLCAEQLPVTSGLTLHGASCHACLFAPETSCERGNKYLDRNCLVPTLSTGQTAFFAARPQTAAVVTTEPAQPGTGGNIPILDFAAAADGVEVGTCRHADFQLEESDDPLFAVRVAGGLEEMLAPGSLCLFRRLGTDDELPEEDSLVLVRHPDLSDPDWGSVTLRRFFHKAWVDSENKPLHHQVILRPRSVDKKRYQTQYLTIEPAKWPGWRPMATWCAQMKAKGG